MSDTANECRRDATWNVLTDSWLEVMSLDAEGQVCSPLEALSRPSDILCIAAASPLDLFAAYRFLLTLLYWKADAASGIQPLRESLLRGVMPPAVLSAIRAETPSFQLFDDKAPFLQDISVPAAKKEQKSAGSLFAEFASGTNIAHFHHGDDTDLRLCGRCATVGMLRVVPWTQSGGQGKSPAVHNAPPIMAIASGRNLAVTLGLNLVVLSGDAGAPKWTGHFKPTDPNAAIPYLEALTWNPRRVLLPLKNADVCWRCGRVGVEAVGPIVYKKNDNSKKPSDGRPFKWQDPAAFYAADRPYITMKSAKEEEAALGCDLGRLVNQNNAPTSAIVAANPNHHAWRLVIPCTNPANNKTFDHRQLELKGDFGDAVRANLHAPAAAVSPRGLDGWKHPPPTTQPGGAAAFVRAAAQFLTPTDWAALSAAAYREMHDSPAAFDVFSGLVWPLKDKVQRLPSRSVLWLVLKLMALVPPRVRISSNSAAFYSPLQLDRQPDDRRVLPRRQVNGGRKDRVGASLSYYPVSFPRGHRLEAELHKAIDQHLRQRAPEPIDWAGLCHALDQLID